MKRRKQTYPTTHVPAIYNHTYIYISTLLINHRGRDQETESELVFSGSAYLRDSKLSLPCCGNLLHFPITFISFLNIMNPYPYVAHTAVLLLVLVHVLAFPRIPVSSIFWTSRNFQYYNKASMTVFKPFWRKARSFLRPLNQYRTFEEFLGNIEEPVLVDFFAQW